MESKPLLSIGITTRNRPESLRRCVSSLSVFSGQAVELAVLDDQSAPPVEGAEIQGLVPGVRVEVMRHETNLGYIVGRNRLMNAARSDQVLLLDDDTRVTHAAPVWEALRVLQSDASFAAIAFAQLEPNGSPWPASMQPAPVDYPCWVPTFIGFAHLLERARFLKLGGYREMLHFYGEEKEYCLRLLDAGFKVLYLPSCGVVHSPDSGGRDPLRYFRYYTRNDCLNALLNLPWPLAIYVVGTRVLCYDRNLRRHLGHSDPLGRRWLVGELRRHWRAIADQRRAVCWSTVRLWQRLKSERRRVPFQV